MAGSKHHYGKQCSASWLALWLIHKGYATCAAMLSFFKPHIVVCLKCTVNGKSVSAGILSSTQFSPSSMELGRWEWCFLDIVSDVRVERSPGNTLCLSQSASDTNCTGEAARGVLDITITQTNDISSTVDGYTFNCEWSTMSWLLFCHLIIMYR